MTPRMMCEANIAEVLEEEAHGSKSSPLEEIKSTLKFTEHYLDFVALGNTNVQKARFLHYLEFYSNPHAGDIHTPPPDLHIV